MLNSTFFNSNLNNFQYFKVFSINNLIVKFFNMYNYIATVMKIGLNIKKNSHYALRFIYHISSNQRKFLLLDWQQAIPHFGSNCFLHFQFQSSTAALNLIKAELRDLVIKILSKLRIKRVGYIRKINKYSLINFLKKFHRSFSICKTELYII